MGTMNRVAVAFIAGGKRAAVVAAAFCALTAACAGPSRAQPHQPALQPQGVYSHATLPSLINEYYASNGGQGNAPCPPSSDPQFLAGLHDYLKGIYSDALANPAVSGIVAGMPWCLLEPNQGVYDWSWLEDVFQEAQAAQKNVQLHITPGVDSPLWLFDPVTNPSCDPVIQAGTPNPAYQRCGWATFSKIPEKHVADESDMLPLPWSAVYNGAWQIFLQNMNRRFFGANPQFVPLFVGIAVAGPVAASTEMILPTSVNGQFKYNKTLDVDEGWELLIDTNYGLTPRAGPGHYLFFNSWDQAFVIAWEETIFGFENIFSGVTLVLIPDDGGNMPELPVLAAGNPTELVEPECVGRASDPHPQSCAAKAIVLSGFSLIVRGPNGKATMVGGLKASNSTETGYINLPGVKYISSLGTSWGLSQVLAGAEFDFPVSGSAELRKEVGCVCSPGSVCDAKTCHLDPDTPEQAAYNVLGNFFDGTIAAGHYGHQAPLHPSPLHFLLVAHQDVLYAKAHPCMQQLLTQASVDLLATANKAALDPSQLDECAGLIQ